MKIMAIITLAVAAITLSACAHKEEAPMTSSSTMTKSSYSK